MTRKDYVKIAKVFNATLPNEGSPERTTWAFLRNTMATMLKEDNCNFSRERFNAACEERE